MIAEREQCICTQESMVDACTKRKQVVRMYVCTGDASRLIVLVLVLVLTHSFLHILTHQYVDVEQVGQVGR